MKLRNLAIVVLTSVAALALAQQAPHVGSWSGTMKGNGGRDVPLEVTLTEGGGTWRMTPSSAGARNNPCFAKDMPIQVERKEDTVVLDVHGDKVIAGCMNQRATLTLSGNQMTGAFVDGRGVTLTRK